MHKAVHLSGDCWLDIYWDKIDGVLTLTELVLKRNGKRIGVVRQTLFEEGLVREIKLGSFIEKAEELAAALSQEGDNGFFVLDSEGRIIGYGESADRAFDDAERKGWAGWVSPHSADEETALLVPRDKVRVVRER